MDRHPSSNGRGLFSSVSSWPPPTAHLRRRSHRCQAMAATNKCLAQSHKSSTGAEATNKPPAARRDLVALRT